MLRTHSIYRRALANVLACVAFVVRTHAGDISSSPSGARHWSLQPILIPPAPTVTQSSWVRNPIDAFVLKRLEGAGLHPSSETDRATLIRRLSLDLIGLPPSPAEVDEFTQDSKPDAYPRLVERLLASPHYGERWARHWLDIVRYTESQGFEYDRLRDNAWHYRDYVINSFNQDKPYHQFMREQVSGDAMSPMTRDGLIATSLLVCGPYDEAGNAQANATQRMTTREDEMEDLISVVGQSFLGLTVNCARCHAHKFDPIPQDDYYRIKSVFDGVKHGERTIASPEEVGARDRQISELKAALISSEQSLSALEAVGWKAALRSRATTPSVELPPAAVIRWSFTDSTNLSLNGSLVGGATLAEGRLRLVQEGAFFKSAPLLRDLHEKTLEVWVSIADLQQGGGAALSIEASDGKVFDAIVFGERQSRKWTSGSEGFARTKDLGAADESTPASGLIHMVAVYSSDNRVALFRNGVAYGKPYLPSTPLQTFRAGDAHVLLGMRHTGGGHPFLRGEIAQAAIYDRALSESEISILFRSPGLHVTPEDLLAHLSPAEREEHGKISRLIRDQGAALAAIKPLPVSYVGIRKQPEPTHLLKRGDVKSPEGIMTPGALSAIANPRADFELAADAPEAARRLKFGEWLASPMNPLPARVMVNRLWHFHFGQGLVTTPNDFGRSGAPPSHPELLDWLARSFMDSGWSLKSIHRLIVSSATYRQSSRFDAKAAPLDADNLLLWRFAPHRLEAEALRDSMLSVSGEINLQIGGPSFRSFDALTFPANAYVPVDKRGTEYNRRTIYRMNVNSGKEPLLDAFDCPDPAVKTPRRGVTTTPLQALGMMNNSFVLRQAERLAELAMKEAKGDFKRAVELTYRRTLGRSPTAEERNRTESAAKERGLSHVCWVLLNSTEFLFVR